MLTESRSEVGGVETDATPALPGLNSSSSESGAADGSWTRVGPPSGRADHTAIYDPVRDRMIVFGADGRGNDLWVLPLSGDPAWHELTPAGNLPPVSQAATAVYDPVRDRMLVFGGYGAGGYPNGVWALSLAGSPEWAQLTLAGTPPSGRWGHTAIYDPVRDRMVVFGGYGGSGYLGDVWALSLAGSPAGKRPPARPWPR